MALSDYRYTMSSQKKNQRPLKLKIYVNGDENFKQAYHTHITSHNSNILFNKFPDSGFDLLFPEEEIINEEGIPIFSQKLDLNISVALYDESKQNLSMHNTLGLSIFGTFLFIMITHYRWWMAGLVFLCLGGLMYILDNDVYSETYIEEPVPLMLLPRSSTGSKTPIRLSNSIGVIDSGYRGPLIACVDCVKKQEVVISKHQRMFQVVSFSGRPIYVELVNHHRELGTTERDTGGFGSTGK